MVFLLNAGKKSFKVEVSLELLKNSLHDLGNLGLVRLALEFLRSNNCKGSSFTNVLAKTFKVLKYHGSNSFAGFNKDLLIIEKDM